MKYTYAFVSKFWHAANYMIRARLHGRTGLALLRELVAKGVAQQRVVEREAGLEQATRHDSLPGEQRFLAHLTEHQLHGELRDRRERRTVNHLAERMRELRIGHWIRRADVDRTGERGRCDEKNERSHHVVHSDPGL